MKKLAFIVLVAAGCFAAVKVQAQTKIGYISPGELITSMPEFKKSDTILMELQNELTMQYSEMVRDFNEQDSILSSKDTLKFTKTQLDYKKKSLGELYMKIQTHQQNSREILERKQQELMAPIQQKALETIKTVAKENGYAYVLNKDESVLVGPPGDDLLPLVKKKLNIK